MRARVHEICLALPVFYSIITMLGDLETAIVAEDEDAHKVCAEFAE